MKEMEKEVRGLDLDESTRCKHYQLDQDIVAIKMYCCQTFYACLHCHEELADHELLLWPSDQFDEKALLCGNCGNEFDIYTYLEGIQCPSCSHAFNPNCSKHFQYYFNLPS
ncbi:MAG: CHY zinc finger protein [Vicingaceae bacterium]